MDFPLNTSIKIEKDDFDRDSNDNIRNLLFDVEIKVEKELETNDDEDWCVTNFENCGDLLEPMFFKQVTVPEGPQCELCYKHFEDRLAILEHNLTHLRVTILNPTLYQCDHCKSYFSKKQLLIRHMYMHNQNNSRTKTLSYKPKAYKSSSGYEINLNVWNKLVTYKPNHMKTYDTNQIYSKTIMKPRDGMTYLLKYKPKSCKTITTQNCDMNLNNNEKNIDSEQVTKRMRRCIKCDKIFSYKNLHEHMQTVHGEGGYFCGLCNIEFKCERYLKRHMIKRHTDDKKNYCPKGAKKIYVKCDECDAVLQTLYALKTHKRNVHSKDRHVCHICNSELKCKSYLLSHMRRVHYSDGKKHVCMCGKNYRSHRYLMVHKRNAQHN